MKFKMYATVAILLATVLLSGCITQDYTCDDMNTKFNCEGLTGEQCSKDPYVKWAKENCGLGTPENPIGL